MIPVEAAGFCATPTSFPPKIAERRRPGRPESVSPELVHLLRANAVLPPGVVDLPGTAEDQLAPVRGLFLGVIVSAIVWGLLLRLVF